MVKPLFLLAGLLLLANANGQNNAPSLSLPDRCALSKTIAHQAAELPGNASEKVKAARAFLDQIPKVVQIDIVRTGDVQKETVKLNNGSTQERWKEKDMLFMIDSASPERIAVTSPKMNIYELEGTGFSDLQELSWIRDAVFTGKEKRGNLECEVYRAGDRTVWVDPSSRLPIFFNSPQVRVSYQYKTPPSSPLVLPDKFRKRMEQIFNAWTGRPQ